MPSRSTVNDLLAEARSGLDRLTPEQALAAVAVGGLLIDTRSGEDLAALGTVPGAIHVPLSVLLWRLDEASGYADPRLTDRDRHVVLLCAHGYSSSLAAATLQRLGFARATDVIGGFEAWQAAGLPVGAPAAR